MLALKIPPLLDRAFRAEPTSRGDLGETSTKSSGSSPQVLLLLLLLQDTAEVLIAVPERPVQVAQAGDVVVGPSGQPEDVVVEVAPVGPGPSLPHQRGQLLELRLKLPAGLQTVAKFDMSAAELWSLRE